MAVAFSSEIFTPERKLILPSYWRGERSGVPTIHRAPRKYKGPPRSKYDLWEPNRPRITRPADNLAIIEDLKREGRWPRYPLFDWPSYRDPLQVRNAGSLIRLNDALLARCEEGTFKLSVGAACCCSNCNCCMKDTQPCAAEMTIGTYEGGCGDPADTELSRCTGFCSGYVTWWNTFVRGSYVMPTVIIDGTNCGGSVSIPLTGYNQEGIAACNGVCEEHSEGLPFATLFVGWKLSGITCSFNGCPADCAFEQFCEVFGQYGFGGPAYELRKWLHHSFTPPEEAAGLVDCNAGSYVVSGARFPCPDDGTDTILPMHQLVDCDGDGNPETPAFPQGYETVTFIGCTETPTC